MSSANPSWWCGHHVSSWTPTPSGKITRTEGLVRDRLAYCENCQTMRAFFEGNIPLVSGGRDARPGSDYVCATCYSIIATFEQVTPEEFRTAAQSIDDQELKTTLR